MSHAAQPLAFNAMTDAWLPLVQEDGTTVWASPVEVLTGERDGVDLEYPRDDFRVYARLLLSALVQALFAAKDKSELKRRLAEPLTRAEVKVKLDPVRATFDLFGPTPFLQVVPPANPPDKGAAPFVFPPADLFQPSVRPEKLSLPAALVATFIEHTYAGGAGRGYGAGPGGQPGAFTLIDAGTIRRGAWANSLALDVAGGRYAKDDPLAWGNEKRAPKPRAATGLVAGLFFQPRSVWLMPCDAGPCALTGLNGPRVELSPLLPKSELTKKPTKGEDVWTHPCAPMAVNSAGIAAVRLHAQRPAWMGLAQLLDPVSKDRTKPRHPLEGPALVLTQWRDLGLRNVRERLLLLDFDRDKANVKRRFFETFPLTADLASRETVELVRAIVADAQRVGTELEKALTRAHDDRKAGGLALADATSSFWRSTERPFVDWLSIVTDADRDTDDGEARVQAAQERMHEGLRRAALAIFDEHVSLSEFDPRKQERIAKQRRALRRALSPLGPREGLNPTMEARS